jgi:Tol biopolymer transport system component
MAHQGKISFLEVINIETKVRRVVFESDTLFEAPNWSRDGSFLVINSEGLLYKLALDSGEPQQIDTGFAVQNNNDHGISPDGTRLAICHHSAENDGKAMIYTLPIEGGVPTLVTQNGPSYWHGWSPDGKRLCYVAGRDNSPDYNIYSMSVDGGEELQLTSTPGLDDGPEYSTDGQCIYYNSYQTGMMQIWRMNVDGSGQTQLVYSQCSDWFPHPSPDGKKLVFIRYLEDQKQAHPFGQNVKLILLDLQTGEESDLTETFYGGQGSINVPSWSPDSKELAFVSYQK